MARADLGDPGGLEDFREAIELATEAGQGLEVALLHNNLGVRLWFFEGPAASLEVLRAGIAYARARGLVTDTLTQSSLDDLVDTGEHDEVLEIAAESVPRLEASGDVWDLMALRCAQARIHALRGKGAEVTEMLSWLESSARESEDPEFVVSGLGSAALVRSGLGQSEAAGALLAELEAYPGARDNTFYPVLLTTMMRTALSIGEADLAARLVADYEARTPYSAHAVAAANAMLAEARGDLAAASVAYADVAARWERFGVVTEHAFALLGEGRCLASLDRPMEAAPVLRQARGILEHLGAEPALAQTNAILRRVNAAGG